MAEYDLANNGYGSSLLVRALHKLQTHFKGDSIQAPKPMAISGGRVATNQTTEPVKTKTKRKVRKVGSSSFGKSGEVTNQASRSTFKFEFGGNYLK